MASFLFNKFKQRIGDGTIDWDGTSAGVIRAALADNGTMGSAPDKDVDTMSSVFSSANYEINGTGYTRGFGSSSRKQLTCSTAEDDTNDRATYKAADLLWDDSGNGINAGTVKAVILFYQPSAAASDADCIPIAYIDSGGFPITTNGGSLTIKFAENSGGVGVVFDLA